MRPSRDTVTCDCCVWEGEGEYTGALDGCGVEEDGSSVCV